MTQAPGILFTAFEPSGDDHAAPVIAMLREQYPQITIWAMGGPRMKAAGAQLIEETVSNAVMLAGAAAKVREHQQRLRRLRHWLSQPGREMLALVPVDSPAANWSICKLVRQQQPQAAIVHLVAPQLWAWAPWRIRKLRRLTSHVLCLLPFEPDWFRQRRVPATFVGHPLFEPGRPVSARVPDAWPRTPQKLAVLPGSREHEIRKNWPAMALALARTQKHNQQLSVIVALRDESARRWLEESTPPAAAGSEQAQYELCIGQTDQALGWCDAALVVSGTAALQVARHRKPMVTLYRVNFWSWHLLGRWIVQTRVFTLPNLVLEYMGLGHPVPELIPFFGDVDALTQAVDHLLRDEKARGDQERALGRLPEAFAGTPYATTATRALIDAIEGL